MDQTVELEDSQQTSPGKERLAIRWFGAELASPYQLIGGTRATIGRGAEATMSLGTTGVSRSHAEIYQQGPAVVLHDLGSTNGTYVNGASVEYAALAEGHVVRVGDAVGVVVRLPADASGPPPANDLVELGPGLWFGPGLAEHLRLLRRVAPSDLPIAVVGETGTGKEFLARAAHLLSARRGPLHAVNCAALPAGLAEAELFGHARGAFTGAEQATQGHVRAAEGGTLFLDELPELPWPVQAKLLRVLQERQVTPLGATRPIAVDLRVVVAGQRPLDELVATRRLRQDLAARLSGLTLAVPPLRERRLDVGLLLGHLLKQHGGERAPKVDARMLECALMYAWPDNVRELDLLVRRLIALHGDEALLRRSHLPPAMLASLPAPPNDGSDSAPSAPAVAAAAPGDRDDHDLRRLTAELRRAGGNLSRAASAAGISRARAYRLLGDRTVAELMGEPSVGTDGD